MAFEILLVLITAAVTAALTIAVAWILYHRYVKRMLIEWIDEKSDELGAQLEDRVRAGAESGIREGVSRLGEDVVRKTGEGAVRTGLGIIEEGMNVWLRPGARKPGGKDKS